MESGEVSSEAWRACRVPECGSTIKFGGRNVVRDGSQPLPPLDISSEEASQGPGPQTCRLCLRDRGPSPQRDRLSKPRAADGVPPHHTSESRAGPAGPRAPPAQPRSPGLTGPQGKEGCGSQHPRPRGLSPGRQHPGSAAPPSLLPEAGLPGSEHAQGPAAGGPWARATVTRSRLALPCPGAAPASRRGPLTPRTPAP